MVLLERIRRHRRINAALSARWLVVITDDQGNTYEESALTYGPGAEVTITLHRVVRECEG